MTLSCNVPIKIALIVPSLVGGGAERVVVWQANLFAEAGFDVQVVLFSPQAAQSYLDELHGDVSIIQLRDRNFFDTTQAEKILRRPLLIKHLVRYFYEKKPDVVFTHNSGSYVVAAKMLTKNHPKIIVMEHVLLSGGFKNNGIKNFLVKTIHRFVCNRADFIVGVSKGIIEELRTLCILAPDKNASCIYNPVVGKELKHAATKQPTHEWLLNKCGPVFIGAGRLATEKNFDLLIRAFAHVRFQRDAKLIICGEGDERGKLEKLIHDLGLTDYVSLPGFCNNLPAAVSHADVFVLSSNYEGFGNVIVEAMACGCPVVSTNCPCGPAEILENGKWGILTPPGDEEALAKAMIETYDNPIDPALLKQRATFFSEKAAAVKYLKLVHYLVGH